MISTRHKPRGWSDHQREFDLTLRRVVREAIRHTFPEIERPPGTGWLYAPLEVPCPQCSDHLWAVSVPRVQWPGLCYCPTCEAVRVYIGDKLPKR